MSTAQAEASEKTSRYNPAVNGQQIIDRVADLLREAGHTNPTGWISGLEKHCGAQVKDEPAPIARCAVNSYWRYALGMHATTGVDTSNERFCIEDSCEEKEWHELMKKIVVPGIVKFGL